MAIDPEEISFANRRNIAEYCEGLTGDVVPIVGTPETGIILAERNPCFFSGDTNSGNTLLMLQLMKCLITGEPFLRRFPVIPTRDKIVWLNLDRDSVRDRMVAMGFTKIEDPNQIRCMDLGDLQGLDFEKDPNLLLRIASWTDARYIFLDNVNLLVSDSASNALGQSFARAIKQGTQSDLQIIGTTQNKKNRVGEENDGVGAVLGSAHIGGASGSIFTLKRSGSVHSTKFKQVKSVNGGEYISGHLTHNHEEHYSRYAGGELMDALMVRSSASAAELAADTGLTGNTVRTRMKSMDPSLVLMIVPEGRAPNGAKKPTIYKYVGPNSSLNQVDEGTQLKAMLSPNSMNHNALPVKELA